MVGKENVHEALILRRMLPTVCFEREVVGNQVLEEAITDSPDRQGRDRNEARAARVKKANREVAWRVKDRYYR